MGMGDPFPFPPPRASTTGPVVMILTIVALSSAWASWRYRSLFWSAFVTRNGT